MAGAVGNADAKKILEFLAREERKHTMTFQKLLDSIGEYKPPVESRPGKYELYVRALVGESIFTRNEVGELMAKKPSNEIEASEMPIGLERLDNILPRNPQLRAQV